MKRRTISRVVVITVLIGISSRSEGARHVLKFDLENEVYTLTFDDTRIPRDLMQRSAWFSPIVLTRKIYSASSLSGCGRKK